MVIYCAATANVALGAGAPPFAVLEIQSSHGFRWATVQIADGPRGIICVVPGARFGTRTVMRIDGNAVWLSDGSQVGIDQRRAYVYQHRYDSLYRIGTTR